MKLVRTGLFFIMGLSLVGPSFSTRAEEPQTGDEANSYSGSHDQRTGEVLVAQPSAAPGATAPTQQVLRRPEVVVVVSGFKNWKEHADFKRALGQALPQELMFWERSIAKAQTEFVLQTEMQAENVRGLIDQKTYESGKILVTEVQGNRISVRTR